MTRRRKPSLLSEAILDMAGDQRRLGIMDNANYGRITLRHPGGKLPNATLTLNGDDIRAMNERENLS